MKVGISTAAPRSFSRLLPLADLCFNRIARILLFLIGCGAASAVIPSGVCASPSSYALPDHYSLDKLGVDLGTLMYERRDTFLTIDNLSWTFNGHNNDDEFDGWILYAGPPASGGFVTQVKLGGNVYQFLGCDSGACTSYGNSYGTLVKTATNWIYTSADGTVYTFSSTGNFTDYNCCTVGQVAVVTMGELLSIRRPSGELLALNYASGLKSVVSSRGYALMYGSTSMSLVNLASHTCDLAVTSCDGVDATIGIAHGIQVVSALDGHSYTVDDEITDLGGGKWDYGIEPYASYPFNANWMPNLDGIGYFRSPDGHEVIIGLDAVSRISSFTDNRGTWAYSYGGESELDVQRVGPIDHTVVVKDPQNNAFYSAHVTKGNLTYHQDALGNQTQYATSTFRTLSGPGYVEYSRLNSITQPEGNVKTYGYDARGNITSVTDTPKPSSGQSATSITASYPATCTNPITCNKPVWTKDSLGNETDYTYDPVHGGVLSEMAPAPASGKARPLKLTTWIQKTPYYRNPSGAMTSSGKPVWVVSTETQCQTLSGTNPAATCDPAAPIRVTTYQYLADSAANSLWPHGVSVAADGTSRLTCFTYDALGNKVSETKPLGAPSNGVCP